MTGRRLATSYARDAALLPTARHKALLAAAAIAALVFPLWASSHAVTVANLSLIAVVGAVGLSILTGFAGQISLAHAAFLALGAYTMAVAGHRLQLPWWLILPGCGLLSAGVGLAIGGFALRLRGLYLAIVTLGLIYVVQHVLFSLPSLTGGMTGLSVPVHVWFGESEAQAADVFAKMQYGPFILEYSQKIYFAFLAIAAVAIWAGLNLARSSSGRAMMAVRDHDLAAASLGVNPARAKIAAFVVSSFFAGVAGGMWALEQQYLTIEPFGLLLGVEYVAMIVLGGMSSIGGAVAGAIAFTALHPVVEVIGRRIPYLNELSSAQQSTVLFSILVCAVLVFEPEGLHGVWQRVRRAAAAWPFRY